MELGGFADPRGSQTYNIKLSTRRVNTVREALIAAGVQKERIATGAYGELNPRCVGSEECWGQDRRVVVIVLPTAQPGPVSLRTGNGK